MNATHVALGRFFLIHHAARSPVGLVIVLAFLLILIVISRRQR